MGIFGAMTTAVSGLTVQAVALENISGNIANSQTTGFKKVQTSFADMIAETSTGNQMAGSVGSSSRFTNSVQGDVKPSSVATNMAIRGDGFFVVQQPSGKTATGAVFSTTDLYTRRGDFDVDSQGYLVNGAGMYLKGIAVDPATGNLSGNVPKVMQVNTNALPAQPSTVVNYKISLPTVPNTQNAIANPTDPNASLMTVAGSVAGNGAATITKANAPAFLNQTISGGTVTVFNSLGAPQALNLYWGKTGDSQWSLYFQNADPNSAAVAAGDTVFTKVSDYTFVPSTGALLTPANGSVNIPSVVINGTTMQPMSLQSQPGGMSQFYNTNGVPTQVSVSQNGYQPGVRTGIQVTDTGRVQAVFSNNQRIDLYQISLVTFSGVNGLQRVDGDAWAATQQSGTPIQGASGKIVGSNLEASNVDISDEFTKMIVTQQAYAANTKVVTTSNDMLQQTINMIR